MTRAEADHDRHEMPTSGGALTSVALSATLHCLHRMRHRRGAGHDRRDRARVRRRHHRARRRARLLFGYGLTSIPLLRAGLAPAAVIPIALASDTLSIAVMEFVDNAIMLGVPGAMEAGVTDVLFWGALSFALVVAGAFALPVNRWLIARGKGHAVVHETGIHGGPSPRLVGAIAAAAFVFGTAVLAGELLGDEQSGERGARAERVTQAERLDPGRALQSDDQ